MKNHEINQAIGESIGETPRILHCIGAEDWTCFQGETKRECEDWLDRFKREYPNANWSKTAHYKPIKQWRRYHEDDNAMRQALTTLTSDQKQLFIQSLGYLIPLKDWDRDTPDAFILMIAPVKLKAQAFLDAIGKWKEEPGATD